jgi:hypothetical protein
LAAATSRPSAAPPGWSLASGSRSAGGTANAIMTLKDPIGFEQQLINGTPFAIAFANGDYSETITGIEVPLGPATASIAAATIANRAELLVTRPWRPGQELSVDFQPIPGVKVEIQLIHSTKSDLA